jgi:ATP-binding cassette subfamily F protein 3
MTVLNMHKIEKSYGITEVLKDFSMNVNEGERIGLIGPNGSGKTTVFKIIAGIEPVSGGNLAIKKGTRVGYLSQMPDFEPTNTLYEELRSIFLHLVEIERKLREQEKLIAQKGKSRKEDEYLNNLMTEYSQLQHRYEAGGGYEYESKIKQVANGMGFSFEELNNKRVEDLSGGEKTRLGLIKLLLTEPNLLLLDEPTNHLDLPSIQWLEEYLREYNGTVIIVSHDRYFLDVVIERIVEIKNGQNEDYYGNYSYYLEERKRRYEQNLKAYENQQKKIKKMEEAIKRLHQWGQQGDNQKFFKRAQSMQKALDRIERIDKPILDGKQMGLELAVNQRSGQEVLTIQDLSKSFGELVLLKGLDLNVYWGEKVALIGRNGTGKTTLIKIILDEIEPDSGSVKIGANVRIGYYSQEFEGFNPDDDLITALRKECSMTTQEARNALAAFLFTEDEVFKRVGDLSGGEKSRLRLLQLMNGEFNFLVLDEPTNHLDLPSREVLEDALKDYPGTILVISHDRYFLNKITELTYELEEGILIKYYGNYDYYRQKKRELVEQEGFKEDALEPKEKSDYHKLKEEIKKERKRQNRIREIENEIENREELLNELEKEMIKPENLEAIELLNELKKKYELTQKELNRLYDEWNECLEGE